MINDSFNDLWTSAWRQPANKINVTLINQVYKQVDDVQHGNILVLNLHQVKSHINIHLQEMLT